MNTANDMLVAEGLHESFWGKKIIAAEKRGHFTASNLNAAQSWVTCACGKASHHIEWDNEIVGPADDDLHEYGCEFYTAVHDNKFINAAELLACIENRSEELFEQAIQEVKEVPFPESIQLPPEVHHV